jgi:broad specificity phosphatase PhoE
MVTILLVRHADIDLPPASADPSLNEAGRQRAGTLAQIIGPAGITAVFTSRFRRTRETAAPTVELTGLTAQEMPPDVAGAAAAGKFGPLVLIVGHSNTVPAVIAELGVPSPPVIRETDFDNLFIVTVTEGGVNFLALKYVSAATGAASPSHRRPYRIRGAP